MHLSDESADAIFARDGGRSFLRRLVLPASRSALLRGLVVAIVGPALVTGVGRVVDYPRLAIPLLLYLLAVISGTLVGLLLPGLVAALASAVGLVLFLPPYGSVPVDGGNSTAISLGLFLVVALATACALAGAHAGRAASEAAERQLALLIEGANNGVHGSPAFALWHDSKWMEFYQYDAYLGAGMMEDAARVFTRFTSTTDNFPRAGTHWFRDWFYPLWRDHGHAQVMVKFFKLLATHFPKNGTSYSRNLNWGEFVHFMSGAAGTDLEAQATMAFGWPPEREAQFTKAKTDFPMITY
jgi:hypothetical protein